MNDNIIMEHISLQLHTSVKKYSKTNELLCKICKIENFFDVLEEDFDSLNKLLNEHTTSTIIFSLNKELFYGIVPTENFKYLVGPVKLEIPFDAKFNENIKYDINVLNKISVVSNATFTYNITFLSNIFNEYYLSSEELSLNTIKNSEYFDNITTELSNYLFLRQEFEKKHNSYEQELREQSSIENGDLESLEKAFNEDIIGELGILAKDKLRNAKNGSIVIITLASRSAIRGGLSPEEAYSYADIYTQAIEEINDLETLTHYIREIEREYTRRVYEIKNKKNLIFSKPFNNKVNLCKNFIFCHLNSNISVHDIATELNMNPVYLSELFKKYEGVTISQYILIEKINKTKNLLKYSKYDFIEIATYLGFCSQSHLGNQFKKHTGYTLKKYRDEFGNFF